MPKLLYDSANGMEKRRGRTCKRRLQIKKRVTCRHEKGGFIYAPELSVKQQKGKEHEYQTQI